MAKRKFRFEYPDSKDIHTLEVRDANGQLLMTVRNCQHGFDEHNRLRKVLYCTADGRFFTCHANDWHLQKECFNPGKRNHRGGSVYPCMSNFGNKNCHLLIAYAWLGPRPKGMECDHLNGDRTIFPASNLQWITPAENRRRAKILRVLRASGTDPCALSRPDLLALFTANNVAGDVYEGE